MRLLWAVMDRPDLTAAQPHRWPEDQAADLGAITRIAAGDADALAELYDRHARAVFSLVFRIASEQADAEDVVQEVFAQVWAQASRYDQKRGAVGAWLLTIARTRAIDRVRAIRAQPDASQLPRGQAYLELPDPTVGQEAALLTAEQLRHVRKALTRLPTLQRLAIELAYYGGLTQAQIAEQLEQPLGTIKTRIRLGLLKLRDVLAEVEP